QVLQAIYENLKQEAIFKAHFKLFKAYQMGDKKDISAILNFESAVTELVRKQPEDAKKLKQSINKYFRILNLIAFVIEIDDKYSEEHFTEFWYRFSVLYNSLVKPTDLIDDVEVYFDNRIGIVAPPEEQEKSKKKSEVKEPSGKYGKQYKFDILAVIEKRNEEEEEIEALILDFQHKIESFFEYVNKEGARLIAKMKSTKTVFDEDEIYKDFEIIFKKYIRRNKKELGSFFIKETEDIVNQLCDDFEKTVKS